MTTTAVPIPPSSPRPRPGGARRERVRRIRRTVVAWTVVAFVALWGAVYVQMRSGGDPVLGAGSPALVSTKTGTATGTSGSTASTATGTASTATGTASSSVTSSSGTASSTPAAVSTSQS
ncbi:MAG: hypothetical protein QOH43_2884 [Solirubrobacteraceae bacterium]|jgi:hypothetical protein|nr:hypothetical protein [Solirubrobacteraceae bacterium]